MSLVWREQMSVHNNLIDKEHKNLIDLINAVEIAINTDDNRNIVMQTLDSLLDYTKTHFEHEEIIQQKINNPGITEHKEQHLKLIDEFSGIKSQLDKLLLTDVSDSDNSADGDITDDELDDLLAGDEPEPSLSKQDLDPLVELMRRWLVDHIIGTDLKLKPLLLKHPVDLSYD